MTTTTTSTTVGRSRQELSKYPVSRDDRFPVVGSKSSLGFNAPQRMGRALWKPMFAMALMGWAVGFVLSIVEAGTGRSDVDSLQTLGHLVPGFMFVGFLGVFAAISFAVARILGEFRQGGGDVQASTGGEVQTLKMPPTAKIMLAFMMMAMMVMGAGIVTNFIAAGAFDGSVPSDVIDSAQFAAAASGLRRLGVAMYLTGIAFGLGAIIEVLRFQTVRIREVAAERAAST